MIEILGLQTEAVLDTGGSFLICNPDVAEILDLDWGRFVAYGLIATVVASPITYLGLQEWLDSFAYSFDLGVGTFMVAGAATIAVALLTVGWESVKAATLNPVESLRQE